MAFGLQNENLEMNSIRNGIDMICEIVWPAQRPEA
jgi:hypothetical protein